MARRNKRSAVDRPQSTRQNKKQHTPQFAMERENCEETSSSETSSNTEITYVNENGELRFNVVQEQMKNAERNMQDNRKRAEDFEALVEQHQLELLESIARHEEQIHEQDAVDANFQASILSVLKPVSLDQRCAQADNKSETKIKTSMIAGHGTEMFDHSEKICKTTTDYLRTYADLAKRRTLEPRISNTRDRLVEDTARVVKLIAAGSKRIKAAVQSETGGDTMPSRTSIKLLREEENDAAIFEGFGGGVSEEDGSYSSDWQNFRLGLVDAVEDIEILTKKF